MTKSGGNGRIGSRRGNKKQVTMGAQSWKKRWGWVGDNEVFWQEVFVKTDQVWAFGLTGCQAKSLCPILEYLGSVPISGSQSQLPSVVDSRRQQVMTQLIRFLSPCERPGLSSKLLATAHCCPALWSHFSHEPLQGSSGFMILELKRTVVREGIFEVPDLEFNLSYIFLFQSLTQCLYCQK